MEARSVMAVSVMAVSVAAGHRIGGRGLWKVNVTGE
jgi:hypothetical protein